MALFIRDETVDALADELKEALKAPSKKEAVRTALERELARVRRKKPVRERIEEAIRLADAMGPSDPTFDFRKFRQELWGEDD